VIVFIVFIVCTGRYMPTELLSRRSEKFICRAMLLNNLVAASTNYTMPINLRLKLQ